ncbi:LOW QUALITY PROTEIN: microtubule cross-linking factor 1 [Hippocampus comes]|uniref:LOW QUALITY PROTEIN: microtubule cross-linking factor 1 n=1 Tax=Hippocampus comes TaxID=109280 RepID=UPI00094ED8FB|nr:PREDICTED: LOW QUALITY PROTEIN: microtubule cross-linking factor 1 [Hippocampus comes]
MMETSNGSAGSDTRPSQPEKKRPNRVPSPARPFLKDVHARAAKPPAIGPKSPKLGKQQAPNRGSRRNITAAKEKPAAAARSSAKAGLAKKPSRLPGAEFKATSSPILAKAKKGNLVPACPGHGSPVRVPTGLVGQTDSSSDLSDCPSELAPVASSDAESGTGSSDKDHPGAERPLRTEPPATAATLVLNPAAKATMCVVRTGPEKKPKGPEEELLREIEDLRSENDYLKDEAEELRAEMEELRDTYMDEEVYQLQEPEDENEQLRQRIIEVEISKQALHNELERAKETALRRRGSSFKDKKSTSQDDSADLRCQLQFAKEESGLMRKKMAKLGREKDELEQELQKYKSVYGDVDSPLPLAECSGGGPHSTREAELRLRLKLVEEEANILGRKIVELEVENRSLRAENDDIRCQYERDCFGREPFSSMPSSPYGGDVLESAGELRRHLQFVEEEAELLRRSISEIEDHNRQLTSELNRFKFSSGLVGEDGGEGGLFKPANGSSGGMMMEELKSARMQINDLSGKVMKLQYENRVLLSNVQRCDLAAHLGLRTGSPRDSDADSDAGRREVAEDVEAGRLLLLQPKREGPIGGESDSEDLFEKTTTTSGFGSIRPSDGIDLSAGELANRRREERESFANVKREADRLGKSVDRLITDTDSLILEGRLLVTIAEGSQGGGDSQVLDTINTRMKAFRTELHIFVEKLDGLRERTDDLSPMPNLTESSSFLSTVTSMSRDSPIGNFGRDLMTDIQSQSGQRDELEWRVGQERGVEPYNQSRGGAAGLARYHRPLVLRTELREAPALDVQLRLDHDRRMRVATDERDIPVVSLPQEDEGLHPEPQRPRLELPGLLQAPEVCWAQERSALQQEVRLFQRNTAIFYMKLKSILARWRLGSRDGAMPDDGAQPEVEKSEGVSELGGMMQQVEAEGGSALPSVSPSGHLQYQHQFGENRRMLQALRTLLEQFREELREEEARRCQLQQAYANDKATWEVKWAEMKCQLAQVEEEARGRTRGQAQGLESVTSSRDPEWALKQEREEHRRLLAESHNTSLDLRWRLQHGEKRWSRERAELLEHFERQRLEWDGGTRELHHKMERLQRELNCRRGEGTEDSGSCNGARSPRCPRSPQSPRSSAPSTVLPARSLSDSDTLLAEQGGAAAVRLRSPTESPFLDALSLDPLASLEVPPPCRLESEKRFPCMKEALDVISEREGAPDMYPDEEMSGGSLLRAKSVCSMSDFQRLMDSSPFLPDKMRHGERGQDDVTPPLSPDDLKYIEEFNNKGWDLASSTAATFAYDAWTNKTSDTQGVEPVMESFQPPSWFLTTSASLTTTSTLNSRAGAGEDAYGVHILHSPTRPGPEPDSDLLYAKGIKARGDGEAAGGSDEVFTGGRWPCGLLEAGGLRTSPNQSPICPTVGYASSLELQLSRNMSDDMKEVAISVRNAIRSPPGPVVHDIACQTNGFTTRGTQTMQTINVGLQTDLLRNLTNSPHRCLTPKGGGTPISSPSRNTRKVQYSPVIQSKFERPCCSPKYGSPKLQRKMSSSNKAEMPNTSRAATPTTPQKGNSESAWARSTTTRDSPVHTTINDGLSSLFNIIDHTPVVYDAMQKFNKSPSRSRPTTPPSPAPIPGAPGAAPPAPTTINDGLSSLFNIIDHTPVVYDAMQKFNKSPSRSRPTTAAEPSADPRSARGRSPSPVQLIVETQGDRNAEVVSIRQDLSAPPGYTLAENAARLLNKKLQDERRMQAGGIGSKMADPERAQPGCMEDLPRSPVAPPLESQFLRPARPANRRPPSRWANLSPPPSSASGRRFTFPPPGRRVSDPEGDAST